MNSTNASEIVEEEGFVEETVKRYDGNGKKPIIITFSSGPGGTGKSTSAYILARVLAQKGMNVALIDPDPQKTMDTFFEKRITEIAVKPREGGMLERFKEKLQAVKQRFSGESIEENDFTKVLTLEDLFPAPGSKNPPLAANLEMILSQPEMEVLPNFRLALNRGELKVTNPMSTQKDNLIRKILALRDYDFVVVDNAAGAEFWKVDVALCKAKEESELARICPTIVCRPDQRGLVGVVNFTGYSVLRLAEHYVQKNQHVAKLFARLREKDKLFECVKRQGLEQGLSAEFRKYYVGELGADEMEDGIASINLAFEKVRENLRLAMIVTKYNPEILPKPENAYFPIRETLLKKTPFGAFCPELVGGIQYEPVLESTNSRIAISKTDIHRKYASLAYHYLMLKERYEKLTARR